MAAGGVKAGEAFVEVGLRSKISAGAKMVQKDLRAVSRSLKTVGAGAQAAGAAVAVPVITAMAGIASVYGSFTRKMSEVRAITGATGEDFERLNAKAKELGASTQYSAGEAAEAMKFLGMAGYNTEQILAGIGPTLQLAAAGGLELATAADIASDVSSAFGLAADDIGRVADVLAATANASNTSVEMMGEAFKYAAPLAAAAGQSIEETSAAMGVLANSGIKATVAGTDVAGMLKQMGEKKDDLSALGVEIADADGNMRSITDVMRDFGKATASMTQVDRLNTANAIFGRYAKSALVLSSNIPAIEQLKKRLDESAGSAETAAATMQDNLSGSFKSLTSAAEGLIIALGGGADGILRTIMDTTTGVIRSVTDFLNTNKHVARQVAVVALAVATAATAVFGFGTVLVATGAVVASVSTLIGALGAVIGAITLPAVAITAAVIALGAAFAWVLYESGALSAALTWLRARFAEIMETAKLAGAGIYDALAAGQYVLAAKILWAALKLVFLQGANSVANALLAILNNWQAIQYRFFTTLLQGVWRVTKQLPRLILAAVTGQSGAIKQALAAIFTGEFQNGEFFDTSATRAELASLTAQAAELRAAAEAARQEAPQPAATSTPKLDEQLPGYAQRFTAQDAYATAERSRRQTAETVSGVSRQQSQQLLDAAGFDSDRLELLNQQQLTTQTTQTAELQRLRRAAESQRVYSIAGGPA